MDDLALSVSHAIFQALDEFKCCFTYLHGGSMENVKKHLDEAIAGLKAILADPKVKVDDAIKASDLVKSLQRFRAKL